MNIASLTRSMCLLAVIGNFRAENRKKYLDSDCRIDSTVFISEFEVFGEVY